MSKVTSGSTKFLELDVGNESLKETSGKLNSKADKLRAKNLQADAQLLDFQAQEIKDKAWQLAFEADFISELRKKYKGLLNNMKERAHLVDKNLIWAQTQIKKANDDLLEGEESNGLTIINNSDVTNYPIRLSGISDGESKLREEHSRYVLEVLPEFIQLLMDEKKKIKEIVSSYEDRIGLLYTRIKLIEFEHKKMSERANELSEKAEKLKSEAKDKIAELPTKYLN